MPKLDKQDQRIADIFGTKDVPDVTDETLRIYHEYLTQHLDMPCQVTGIEDMGCFAWEEYYTFSDLQATDATSKNHEFLDDYVTWFVNWR